jgi:hypothetical protein
VSPAYARALEGVVPDGSLTGGAVAKARRVLGHIDDLMQSVTDSPKYFGVVAGDYADVVKEHLPEIIGITAGFIVAESASALLAATPTGVGQLAAVIIQLGLAAFGAGFAASAGIEALKHGERWLTLAWTAHGDAGQLAHASQAFLHMLVSIAMAALAMAGVRGNMGKGLKVADAVHIQPPMIGMSPAMAGAGAGSVAGGPVFIPGSITSAGPVNIGISTMSGVGSGGSKAGKEAGAAKASGKAESGAKADTGKAAQGSVSYGKNAMVKLRKHSQHMRETARELGIEIPQKPGRPETFAAMDEFINKVISEGTAKTGQYMTVEGALWSRLGNALVIRRPTGEFLTFLDYSKGGVAKGWDLLP